MREGSEENVLVFKFGTIYCGNLSLGM